MTKAGRIVGAAAVCAVAFSACGDDDGNGSATTGNPPDACASAVVVDDPSTTEGDTRELSHTTEGSCNTSAAPEAIFRVTAAVTGTLDVVVESTDKDFSVYARTTCSDPMTEIGCSEHEPEGQPETLHVPVTAGQDVWIFVDGYQDDTAGRFTLRVESRAIVCGDSLVEGEETCDPPDQVTCTAECQSIPEVCDDGNDNDADTLFDCEDTTDCGANAACPLAATCMAAPAAGPNENGDASGGGAAFAGSCTGAGLVPEALYTYLPTATGILSVTLQSATDLGVYVRAGCEDPATELGCRDKMGTADEALFVPVVDGEPVTIFVDALSADQAGPFTLQTDVLPSSEAEPNDTSATATAYPGGFDASVYPAGDADWVSVDVPGPGSTLTATIADFGNGACLDYVLDSMIEVFGPDGTTLLASNDDATTFCSEVVAEGLAAGTYYLRVTAARDAAKPIFAYRLDIQVN